jgi:hypothetical protein
LKDLTGQRFGKLTAITFSHRKGAHYYWQFECDCGNKVVARTDDVGKATFSCGCYQKEKVTTHKETKTRLYRTWRGIINRCRNQNEKDYKDYGKRGITVCEEWQTSFESFRDWANANGYADSLTIDRIDNNKGYSPDNCRWATRKEQSNNTRRNRLITLNGETLTATQWNERLGYPRDLILNRISLLGWTDVMALLTEPRVCRGSKNKNISIGGI